VPAQCVVVEDAPAGLEAARAANMRVIAVATTYPPEALSGADVVTRALNALTVRVHGGDPACLEVEVRITTTQS
jgi:sugar-phosphatase